VIVDPPYDEPALASAALEMLGGDSAWLSPTATVVIKHFWRDEPPPRSGVLARTRQKRFGETMLSYYTRAE
jgi:16S rRNA G966 N2-methylase RsmD